MEDFEQQERVFKEEVAQAKERNAEKRVSLVLRSIGKPYKCCCAVFVGDAQRTTQRGACKIFTWKYVIVLLRSTCYRSYTSKFPALVYGTAVALVVSLGPSNAQLASRYRGLAIRCFRCCKAAPHDFRTIWLTSCLTQAQLYSYYSLLPQPSSN